MTEMPIPDAVAALDRAALTDSPPDLDAAVATVKARLAELEAAAARRALIAGAGEDDAEVWIPPLTDCMDHRRDPPCPHCGSTVFHQRTGRCGDCGRRPLVRAALTAAFPVVDPDHCGDEGPSMFGLPATTWCTRRPGHGVPHRDRDGAEWVRRVHPRADPPEALTDAAIAHRLADALHAECVARWALAGVGAAVTKHGLDWHAAQVEALVPVVRGLVADVLTRRGAR